MEKNVPLNKLNSSKVPIMAFFFTICICISAFAQTRQITGKVTSADDGAVLSGASVTIKGTSFGNTTDQNGTFKLSAARGTILSFSFVGYITLEITVGDVSTYDVKLSPDLKTLAEVNIVTIGYGTTRRKDLTGSISSVTAETIEKIPVTSVDQALQGRAAGVQVINNDGTPGGGVIVLIRGVGSLGPYANNPLYVVDGYPISGGINNINPNDIASIDVLKDASATAIYGVRAASGVVIITTKKGRTNGTQISLDYYNSIQTKPKEYKVLNAQQWATLANEVAALPGQTGFVELPEWSNPASLTNVDWQNAVYRVANKNDYNVGIRGGNDKLQFAISGGHLDQKGIVLGSYFKRLSVGINADYLAKSWLKTSVSAKYSVQDSNNPNDPNGFFNGGLIAGLGELIPTITGNKLTDQIKDGKGNYGFYTPINSNIGGLQNPVYNIANNELISLSHYFLSTASIEATIIDGLKIKTNAGVNISDFFGSQFTPTDDRAEQQYSLSAPILPGFYSQMSTNTYEWLWENTLSYDKTFGRHTINFVGGISEQENTFRTFSGHGVPPNNVIRDLSQVTNLVLDPSYSQTYSLASQFARLSYKFDNKYLLTGTVRRDGSSKFAAGHQYGIFPSGAAAWRVKQEAFLKNTDWLSDLKFRVGYGEVGNQSSIGLFQYAALISTGGPAASLNNYGYPFGGIYQPGIAPIQPPNPNLKWETDYQTDVAVDASFLHGDLTLTVDYYNRRSKDFLLNIPASAQTGYTQALAQNLGSIDNKGFELTLNYNHTVNDFKYGAVFTLTTVQNKLLSILKNVNFIDDLTGSPSRTYIGQPVGEFFGYKSLGIFQTQAQIDALNANAAIKNPSKPYYQDALTVPGDRYFADINGDGQVTASDRTSLGSPIPKFYSGLNLDAAYKAFDINIYFYGTYGNKILNLEEDNLESFENGAPQNVSYNYYINRWTPTNPSNIYSRAVYNNPNGNNNISSAYVQNGSYLRLKNVTLGYTLPAALLKKIAVTKIRVYFSTQNLFTITGYTGLDPEVGIQNGSATASGVDNGIYPSSRFYTFGLNVTL